MKKKNFMKNSRKLFSAIMAAAMITTTVAPQSLVWAEEAEDVQGFGDGEASGEELAVQQTILDDETEFESVEEGFADVTEFFDDAGEILDEDSFQSAENIEAMVGDVETYADVVDVKTPDKFGESFTREYAYTRDDNSIGIGKINMYSVQNGTYKLSNDVTLDGTLFIASSSTVTIDLNGHTLSRGLTEATHNGFGIDCYGKLTITDSSKDQTGVFTGAYNKNYTAESNNGGGAVIVRKPGVFTLDSGTISGNKCSYSGAAVLVIANGTFLMKGGRITNNTAEGEVAQAAVSVINGTFEMSGGSIDNNHSDGIVGGVALGGTSSTGILKMTGGTISENTCGTSDGGLFVSTTGKAYLSGGSITKNQAKEIGGGIYVSPGGVLSLSGDVNISGNTAGVYAGGICSRGTLTVQGKVVVKDNTVNGVEDNIAVKNDSPITVDGKLAADSVIGVNLVESVDGTYQNVKNVKGVVTTGYGTYVSTTELKHFTLDAVQGDGQLTRNASNEVEIVDHVHEWKYEASGNTIKAYCNSSSKCEYYGTSAENALAVLTIIATDTTYDGKAKEATVEGNLPGITGENAKIVYTGQDGTVYEASENAPADAGTYTASVTVGGATAKTSFTIKKAEVQEPEIPDKTYNGQKQIADVPDSTFYKVKTNEGGVKAGSYEVVLELTDSKNYCWSSTEQAETTLKFNITSAQNSWISTPSIAGWTYGEKENAPKAEARYGTDTLMVEYRPADAADTEYTTEVPKKAGDYKVRFTIPGTESYPEITEVKDLTIAKRPVTVKVDDKTITYGDVEPTYTYSVESGSLVDGDALKLTYTRANGNDVGEYSITAAEADGNFNYTVSFANGGKGTLTIQPKEISIDWEVQNFIYNGNYQQPNAAAKQDSLVGNDTCELTVSDAGKDAGVYTAEVVKLSNPNYKLPENKTLEFTIQPKVLDVKWSNLEFIYDGTEKLPTASLTGIVDGDICEFQVSGAATAVGTYTAKTELVNSKNYKLSKNAEAQFVIKKLDPSFQAPTAVTGLTYNGESQTLLVAGETKDGTFLYKVGDGDWTQALPTAVKAGTYTVLYKVVGDENHGDSETGQLSVTIAKKAVVVKGITAKDKIYDGTTSVVLNYSTVQFEGKLEKDSLEVSAAGAFAEKNAGQKKVVITNLVLKGASIGNYELAKAGQQSETTAKIQAKEITVTANNAKKDLGKADPKLTYTAEGLVGKDTLSGITVVRAAGETMGTYTITVSASAAANPNYKITFKTGTFTIEEADQSSLSGKAVSKLNLPLLLAKGKGGDRAATISWLKYQGAAGYEVYWSYCDGKSNYKKFATVKNGKLIATRKNLKSNREYKYFVAAYKMVGGKKVYIAKSNVLHVAMKQAKTTNVTTLKVNKQKVTLKAGKTFRLKCTAKTENAKKKVLSHTTKFRYYTSNSKIATVSKSGVITAQGKGRCKIYVMANNGVYKTIKVTVK